MMKVFTERTGIRPDVAAGLSLGEYCALVAAGVMTADDAIRTVRERGILMQEAVPAGVGGMSAVLGMTADEINAVVDEIPNVQVANYNCPGQIVISGLVEGTGRLYVELTIQELYPDTAYACMHLLNRVRAAERLTNSMLFKFLKKLKNILKSR